MSEKPTLAFGALCIPTVKSNFHTDPGGKFNAIEAVILKMCQEVLDPTMHKLLQAAHDICALNGVELVEIDAEEQIQMTITSLRQIKTEGGEDIRNMVELTPDGKVSRIISGHEAICINLSGRRTDN